MAKKKRYFYSKNEDYLYLTTGTVSKIIELNKEYEFDDNGYTNTRFKTTFSISIPRVEDKRFETCISWNRQTISIGDLVSIKGRYLENGFLVKSLSILRKVQNDGNIQNST